MATATLSPKGTRGVVSFGVYSVAEGPALNVRFIAVPFELDFSGASVGGGWDDLRETVNASRYNAQKEIF